MQLAAGVSCRKCKGSRRSRYRSDPSQKTQMTLGSVPRRRPQPDLRASADASAPLSDTREATSCGQVEWRVPRGLGRLEAKRGCISQPPPRPSDLVLPERASETFLCFLLSIPHGLKSQGVTVPREKRSHPTMPTPTGHHVNAPVKAPAPKTWMVGGRGGSGLAEGPTCVSPQVLTVSGARALPKFTGRCPSRSPTRGPGGRGA